MADQYTYDRHLREGKWEVHIDTGAGYGYYEHDAYGEGGGLWFDRVSMENDTGFSLELRDYDGRMMLPKDVAKALRADGVIVDEVFDW